MTDEQKRWIDNASYEELLRKWRFTPSGDPMFTDEPTYSHFTTMMRKRRDELGPEGAAAASKAVGWAAGEARGMR